MPPELTEIEAVPSDWEQYSKVDEVLKTNGAGSISKTVSVATHPLSSIAVSVYDPLVISPHSAEKYGVVCWIPPSISYRTCPTELTGLIEIAPLHSPGHKIVSTINGNENKPGSDSVMLAVSIHPLASLTWMS